MTDHVMHDIETMSTETNAAIIAIGACKFDPNGGEIVDTFYRSIDLASNMQFSRDFSASTLMWWLSPERDVPRARWVAETKVDLPTALHDYARWFGPVSLSVWGNAASFDNTIVESAYKAVGLPVPWKFWHGECYRTMKNRAPTLRVPRTGTHHHALDDAISQARHLQEIYAAIGLTA